jgi:L-seryl-tRNA(Ser) seleniumtransferase
VDAAADYLIVPNPYLALGADLVAYSGGKIIRGPQTAGLLVGRRDLVRAAWANSAPHHGLGRGMKVSKEDLQADFREWNSWYQRITQQITRVPGVTAEVRPPMRGGPFPTLNIAWDPEKIAMTAGEIGRQLLDGKPRIMSHAEGEGHSFLIRPVAMKPGEHEIVAQRLYEIFRSAPKSRAPKTLAAPVADLSGYWDVEVEYEAGNAHHVLVIAADRNQLSGSHQGWAYKGNLRGTIDGRSVEFRSSLPAEGNQLSYRFRGEVGDGTMSGTLDLGDYGKGRWRARRHA